MNYANARTIIHSLGENAERRENERNARDFDAEQEDQELRENNRVAATRREREEAADLKATVEVFGDLAIDIAESLSKIAGRQPTLSGHNQ